MFLIVGLGNPTKHDGEKCVCVQSISYSLLCRWFRAAVLPQDKELETALFTG